MTSQKTNDRFYAINYENSNIELINEEDLQETYFINKGIITNCYSTINNKICVVNTPEKIERQKYYKLYKDRDVVKEIKDGDIVRDEEDFIYRVFKSENDIYFGRIIGDCELFSDIFDFLDDEGDNDYDS